MFAFGRSKSPSGPIFVIGNSSLFSKKQLTPTEFGREITRLSFMLGIEQLEHYQKARDISTDDLRLLKEVGRNPGIMQLLYVNLMTGAFLCYAKVVLEAPDETLVEIESGVLSELRSTMPGFSEDILDGHKNITVSFSIAIGREILQIERDASISLFFSYFNHYYPEFDSGGGSAVPSGLFRSLTGFGSRVVASCQDIFQITFQQK